MQHEWQDERGDYHRIEEDAGEEEEQGEDLIFCLFLDHKTPFFLTMQDITSKPRSFGLSGMFCRAHTL